LAKSRLGTVWLRACALTILIVYAEGTAAVIQDPFEAGVAAIPFEVREVKSAGRWRATDGEGGSYRVIALRAGDEHVVDRLYVQWIRDAAADERPHVMATLAVSEVNDAGPFTFSYVLKAEATTRLRITVNAHHSYTGERRQFVFFATTPGTVTRQTRQSSIRPK
jgi:hypothetical protein